jgi:hypothetical protein
MFDEPSRLCISFAPDQRKWLRSQHTIRREMVAPGPHRRIPGSTASRNASMQDDGDKQRRQHPSITSGTAARLRTALSDYSCRNQHHRECGKPVWAPRGPFQPMSWNHRSQRHCFPSNVMARPIARSRVRQRDPARLRPAGCNVALAIPSHQPSAPPPTRGDANSTIEMDHVAYSLMTRRGWIRVRMFYRDGMKVQNLISRDSAVRLVLSEQAFLRCPAL